MHISKRVIICGSCDFPAVNHTNLNNVVHTYADGFSVECYRDYDSIGKSSWYDDYGKEYSDYVMVDGITTLNIEVEGTEAQSGSDLIKNRVANDYGLFGIGADEDPYLSVTDPTHELSKLDRWRDNAYRSTASTETWTCTSILGETPGEYDLTVTTSPEGKKSYSKSPVDVNDSISKEERNAYVEGNEGFISLHLLDEQLTRKYHAKLLNVFLDKQTQDVRVGSIRLIKNVDGTLTAKCVNASCKTPSGRPASMTINPNLAARKDMEDFVWSMVQHGNNHAAAWFRTRETFHKVHNLGCSAKDNCHPTEGICQHNSRKDVPSEDLNEVEFLMEHQRYCTDKRCKCNARLEELVGDMDVNSHIMQSA